MAKTRKSSYVPVPKADPETQQRLQVVLLELTGHLAGTEAAKVLELSRLHFQTLRNRCLTAMVEALTPGLPGRPAMDPKLRALQQQVKELEEENDRLQVQAERNEQLIQGLTQTLREVSTPSRGKPRTRAKRTSTTKAGSDDGEAHRRRLLSRAEDLVRGGLSRGRAAEVVCRDPATLRRWRERDRAGRQLARRPGPGPRTPGCPMARRRVAEVVRETRGLAGADSLRHAGPVSRREAAAIKVATLREVERERIQSSTRVTIAQPGVLRGFDQHWVATTDGLACVLVAADGAVPYRTTVAVVERYDAEHVAEILARDFAKHGAPLVLRLDRAACHDAPAVRAIVQAHEVLVLHGPPHLPRYYGQTERQNAEHRAWLEAEDRPQRCDLPVLLDSMGRALNGVWRRRTLGWETSEVMWNRRRHLQVDRVALRHRVDQRAAHLATKLAPQAVRLGTHHRLAIELELASLGLLNLQPGGRC